MFPDQRADQFDALACRPGPLDDDAREIAVVGALLVARRHVLEFLTRRRPDVAHGDTVFVEAAVGQRCGHAQVVAVADADVARRLGGLGRA